jgi:predicted RNase H-like HicB family nuclease
MRAAEPLDCAGGDPVRNILIAAAHPSALDGYHYDPFQSAAEERKIRHMNFRVEIEQEEDGRWIAEVVDLPGALAYGNTSEEAQAKVQALALRVVADRLEHGRPDGHRLVLKPS